jgi:formate dehydrogenase iron-sulfur subunit
VLTQMSVGMFCVAQVLQMLGAEVTALMVAAAVVGFIGQQAAVLHLGRPTIAWRAWLGWRTSWLSREIIVFGVFSGLAGAYVVASLLYGRRDILTMSLGIATCVSGIAGVLCSAMIYVATQREYWSGGRTIPRFLVTAVLLGLAGALATQTLSTGQLSANWLVTFVMAAAALRLCHDIAVFKHTAASEDSPMSRSLDLLTGPLRGWQQAQALAALAGGVLLPIALLGLERPPLVIVLLPPMLLVFAELVQRGLFFASAASPRMPGVSHA